MNDTLDLSRDGLIQQLNEVAERLQKTSVSRSEFFRETPIKEHHVMKHFDSWNDFVRAANLQPTDVSRVPDEQLFVAMRDTFIALGGIVTRTKFEKRCRYSGDVYSKRWGRWENVLLKFRNWVEMNAPDFPYLANLPVVTQSHHGETESVLMPSVIEPSTAWNARGGRQYGPFINFRGLQHAPINEQGVVFLFGMVAQELGYVVESVATGFPDCEAKRQVSKSGTAWERVRIEFEFKSRNFLAHGHDPDKCDIIVCWEHDWSDCPIEVLELRSAIAPLAK